MDWFWKFMASPVGSWLRVFLSVVLGLWVADLIIEKRLHWDPSEWNVWITAGLIAVVPVFIAWLNPRDPRFGVGS